MRTERKTVWKDNKTNSEFRKQTKANGKLYIVERRCLFAFTYQIDIDKYINDAFTQQFVATKFTLNFQTVNSRSSWQQMQHAKQSTQNAHKHSHEKLVRIHIRARCT